LNIDSNWVLGAFVYRFVREGVGDEEESSMMTMASQGFESNDRKELVVIGVVVDEALKDCCNH
jgi:hypothetical protein